MFAKIPAVLALFAAAAQVAVATPPACLLAAVNTQSDPSDIKSVCNGGAAAVQKYMGSNCGDNLDAATSAFAETCRSAGVTISSSTSGGHSSSGTAPPSLSSATLTNGAVSGFRTQTNSPTNSASTPTGSSTSSPDSPSGTTSSGSAPPSETGADAATGGAARVSMDIVGLAALGLAGFMLAL